MSLYDNIVLHIALNQDGLGLPSITSFHKSAVAGKWSRLALSRDRLVSNLAAKMVISQSEVGCLPARSIMEVWLGNSHLSAHKLKLMVAEAVHDHDNQSHLEGTRDLEVQGRLLKTLRDSTPSQIVYRSKAVWSLPAKQMTFAVNSTQDTLPTAQN